MPIVTDILPASTFHPVEAYQQDCCKKNPLRYKFCHLGCGRDRVLERLWGKPAH